MQNTKLQWKTKHKTNFDNEVNFLETILLDCGVPIEKQKIFLHPLHSVIHNPFDMINMDKAVEIVHKHINKENPSILIRVDCDVDGYTSAAIMGQFLNKLNPNVKIKYILNYKKEHGLTYKDVKQYKSDDFDLFIIPDASMIVKDAINIKKQFPNVDIVVLDHHVIENEFYDNIQQKWITRVEAKQLYRQIKNKEVAKDALIVDCYTNYCVAVNCMDGHYPNPDISGAGVVQKFIEGYLEQYKNEDIDENLSTYFLDLVSLGINADAIDLQSLESRYYVLEGMKDRNYNNEFLNELVKRNLEDMKWGRYIKSIGWNIAPKINGAIRYGKEEEQNDTFRAMLGVKEDREYQPRRKSKNDPKPPIEIQSLQKTMARVTENIKARQDTEVRKFVNKIEKKINDEHLDKNSILFVDGTDILTKDTITGLIANKLTGKYFRPVVLLKAKDKDSYGGSCRGYDKGNILSIKDFLEKAGIEVRGHDNAGGVFVDKKDLPEAIKKCNEMMPLDNLCTIHTVDWEIPATQLKEAYVQEVAENYAVWGSTVPEPLFAITNLHINATDVHAYGERNNFIRFVYNGIVFTKKYCSLSDYDNLVLKDRNSIGENKKDLNLNIIGEFVLNNWEDNINPEIKILYFDSTEIPKEKNNDNFDEEKLLKKLKAQTKITDDDFDW